MRITEHHDFHLSSPLEAVAKESDLPIFRAMEYRAEEGHLLIFGLPVSRSDIIPGLPMQHAIDWVNKRGGAAVAAHPFQTGITGRCLGSKTSGACRYRRQRCSRDAGNRACIY